MIKIVINDIPPSLNQILNTHWSRTHTIKNNWAWSIKADYMSRYKQPMPNIEKAKVKIIIFFRDKRERDSDNYQKVILDSLVTSGVLRKDCYKNIGQPEVTIDYDRYFPHTEIYIEEVLK